MMPAAKFLQVSSWVAGIFLSTDSENLSVQNISLISFIFVLPFGQYCEPPSRTKFKQQLHPQQPLALILTKDPKP